MEPRFENTVGHLKDELRRAKRRVELLESALSSLENLDLEESNGRGAAESLPRGDTLADWPELAKPADPDEANGKRLNGKHTNGVPPAAAVATGSVARVLRAMKKTKEPLLSSDIHQLMKKTGRYSATMTYTHQLLGKAHKLGLMTRTGSRGAYHYQVTKTP